MSILGTIAIGIIGSGSRGRGHIEFIKASRGRAEVVALADVDDDQIAQSVKLLASRPAVYKDYRKLLEDGRVDAVVVSSPNFLHKEHAIAALESGRHVLCEKPLATTVEDCQAILEAAKRSPKVFLAGHELRFALVYLKMRELIEQGRGGRLCQIIHTELRGDWNPRGWRRRDLKTGKLVNWRLLDYPSGGTLVEKCCHFTDLFLMMIGANPSRVACTGGVHFYRDGRETLDHASLILEYAGGCKATEVLSMYHRPTVNEFRVLGTEGAFMVRRHRTLDYWDYGKKPERIVDAATAAQDDRVPRHSGDMEMYEAFYDAIRDGKPLPFDNAISLHAVKTCLLGELSVSEHSFKDWKDLPG